MIRIDYPEYAFRTRRRGAVGEIFDAIRKTWLKLTPEEWVRQHFVRYMTEQLQYPTTLIALEKKIMVGEMSRRFDILVYDAAHAPWMLVECKAATVPLAPDVLDQVLRYHIAVPVPFVVITNGNYFMAFGRSHDSFIPLTEMPQWPDTTAKYGPL